MNKIYHPYNKVHVVMHASCLDGSASGYAAWKHFKESANYYEMHYGNKFPVQTSGNDHTLYFVDFCLPLKRLLELKQQFKTVQVIDHHKSSYEDFITDLAIEVVKKYTWFEGLTLTTLAYFITFLCDVDKVFLRFFCNKVGIDTPIFDMNKSGALLTWEYFHSDKHTPEFIKYISDRDLWKFEYENTKPAIEGFKLYNRHHIFEDWDKVCSDEDYLKTILDEGNLIVDYKKSVVNDFVSRKDNYLITYIDNNKVAIYNTTVHGDEIAEAFYDSSLEIDYTIGYRVTNTGQIKLSFRSHPEYGTDVIKIAKKYKGGGHEHSSGALLDLKSSFEFLEMINRLSNPVK